MTVTEMEPPAESTEATDAARYRWLRDHNARIIFPNKGER